MTDIFLILHGTGGNKPDHWQEHLATDLSGAGFNVRYPLMPYPDLPVLDTWLETLVEEMAAIPADARLTVLAHSRGCLLWMHYAAQEVKPGPKADRVLLVAPPADPAIAGIGDWLPAPLDAAGTAAASAETVIVASDDDEFATYEDAEAYATALQIPIYKLSGAGHISPFYGYGRWPWVHDWCLRAASLPPLPNR